MQIAIIPENSDLRLSLYVYLEYGIRWPVTGGELHYVSHTNRHL
jgi:hypothetical protein